MLLEETIAIEDEVLKLHQEYQIKLQCYTYFLESIQHDPLSDNTQNENKIERLQKLLGLTDRDVTSIKDRVAPSSGVKGLEEVGEILKTQTDGEDITLFKPLVKPLAKNNNRFFSRIIDSSKSEMHSGTTLPVTSSAQRNLNSSLNTIVLLLLGAGLATIMALLVTDYRYEQRQDSQLLQKIKTLAEEPR